MKLKRFLVVAAAGGLALPAYWHPTSASVTQCSDNIDNDGDGGIDNDGGTPSRGPKDLDCTSYEDPSEFGPGGAAPGGGSSASSSTATNNNSNTSTNNNNNTSNSDSTSSSSSTSGSSSTACLILCDSELLSNVLSGLPALGG